jgi:TonB family protein
MLFASPGTTVARFDLDRRGAVAFFAVLQSSGTKRLDDFVERVVRRASRRFPPPPAHHPGERFSVTIPIVFR